MSPSSSQSGHQMVHYTSCPTRRAGGTSIVGRMDRVVALHEMEAEFGVPQWAFGYSTYAFISSNAIICSFIKQGITYLGYLDATTGKLDCIGSQYSRIEWVQASPNYAVFICSSPTESLEVVKLDLDTLSIHVLNQSNEVRIEVRLSFHCGTNRVPN